MKAILLLYILYVNISAQISVYKIHFSQSFSTNCENFPAVYCTVATPRTY